MDLLEDQRGSLLVRLVDYLPSSCICLPFKWGSEPIQFVLEETHKASVTLASQGYLHFKSFVIKCRLNMHSLLKSMKLIYTVEVKKGKSIPYS